MKRSAYRYAFGAMIVALAVACSPAPAPAVDADAGATVVATPESSLAAAMEADRAFAAMAQKDGLKPAFLAYMDPTDSQRIEPGVVFKGAEQIAAMFDQTPPGFSVEWTPDGGHGSSGGDMAVTTGRYTVKISGADADTGRYITVWRKDAGGAWKVLMDSGVPDPAAPAGGDAPDPEGRPG